MRTEMNALRYLKKIVTMLTSAAVAAAAVCAATTGASAVVTVDDGVFEYTYSNNAWQLYSYIGSDTEITLPESFGGSPVNGIMNECFMQSGVTKVTIPDTYTYIGNYAFYDCESLRSVDFPATLTEIGMGAFAQSGITSADLSQTKINAVNSYTFLRCAALEDVLLPPTVGSIGEAAFAESGIKSIDLPGATTLDRAAFANTENLNTASLSPMLKSIGESCFENSAVSEIELPESLETIGASAFRGDTNLKELYIPDSVTEIGAYALFPMSIQSTIHVTCFDGSYADTYCYENFVKDTVAYAKVPGDANLDGKVNINDVTAIQRYIAEFENLNRPALVLADVNHNGTVSIDDATTIQRYLAEYDDAVLY